MTYRAYTFWELRKREAAAFAAGVCIAVGSTAYALAIAGDSSEAAEQGDTALKTLCRPPTTEGAMTVWVFEDGKAKCWRWKS